MTTVNVTESDNDVESLYEIQTILSDKKEDGIKKYQIKWIGYETPTWEPSINLKPWASQVIQMYKSQKYYNGFVNINCK